MLSAQKPRREQASMCFLWEACQRGEWEELAGFVLAGGLAGELVVLLSRERVLPKQRSAVEMVGEEKAEVWSGVR